MRGIYVVMKSKVKAKAAKLNLLRDKSGSILPMTAVAMVVLAGMVGGGVDISRAYMVQNKLQNACDAGTLAGRRAVGSEGFDAKAKQRADDFFETNFDEANEGVSNTSFVTTTPDNGNTVVGAASTNLDTVIMRIFNVDDIALSADCQASMSVGNSDVVMVLDVTGSMRDPLDASQTRIVALRNAMKSFYDTVSASADGGNARIRYGFVPYSSSVNVGRLITDVDPSYIADEHNYQSKVARTVTTTVDTVQGYEAPYTTNGSGPTSRADDPWYYHTGSYRNRRTCRNNEPSDTGWTNSGSASTSTGEPYIDESTGNRITETTTSQEQSRTEYACYRAGRRNHWVIKRTGNRTVSNIEYSIEEPIYTTTTTTTFDRWDHRAVDYDTSTFKTFASVTTPTGPNGTNETSTWEGCIEERQTVKQPTFSWSSLLGLNHSDAFDLDIDSAPTNDEATQWKPLWTQISYRRTNGSNINSIVDTPESENGEASDLRDFAACPFEAQGLETMSEEDFDDYADSLEPAGATFHNIGMIWGARLISPEGIFATTVNEAPANGGNVARHIIFMSDGAMAPDERVYSSYGIEAHDKRVTDNGFDERAARHTQRFITACTIAKAKGIRVWVIAFDTGLTPDLENCASDDSAFPANSADQLNAAFQEIAKDVGELRITQ